MRASAESEASQHRSPFGPDACLNDQDLRLKGFECMRFTRSACQLVARCPALDRRGFACLGHGSVAPLRDERAKAGTIDQSATTDARAPKRAAAHQLVNPRSAQRRRMDSLGDRVRELFLSNGIIHCCLQMHLHGQVIS